MSNDREYQRLIHAAKYVRLRRAKLSAQPLCEDCLARGLTVAATEVHHVRPVEEGFSLADRRQRMYDITNLRSLCHGCHVAAHTATGRGGKEANRRRQAAHARDAIGKFFGDG